MRWRCSRLQVAAEALLNQLMEFRVFDSYSLPYRRVEGRFFLDLDELLLWRVFSSWQVVFQRSSMDKDRDVFGTCNGLWSLDVLWDYVNGFHEHRICVVNHMRWPNQRGRSISCHWQTFFWYGGDGEYYAIHKHKVLLWNWVCQCHQRGHCFGRCGYIYGAWIELDAPNRHWLRFSRSLVSLVMVGVFLLEFGGLLEPFFDSFDPFLEITHPFMKSRLIFVDSHFDDTVLFIRIWDR